MKKRLPAALVCILLVLSLLPKTALAEGEIGTLYYDYGLHELHIDEDGLPPYSGPIYTGSGWSGNYSALTLENFHFTTSAPVALSLTRATQLNLISTNT